jgi:hypothetical protein
VVVLANTLKAHYQGHYLPPTQSPLVPVGLATVLVTTPYSPARLRSAVVAVGPKLLLAVTAALVVEARRLPVFCQAALKPRQGQGLATTAEREFLPLPRSALVVVAALPRLAQRAREAMAVGAATAPHRQSLEPASHARAAALAVITSQRSLPVVLAAGATEAAPTPTQQRRQQTRAQVVVVVATVEPQVKPAAAEGQALSSCQYLWTTLPRSQVA